MELNQCSTDLVSNTEIVKNKKKILNTNMEDLDKKPFKSVLDETISEKKANRSKESDIERDKAGAIQNYISISEMPLDDPLTAAVSKLANGFGVSVNFMTAILDSLKISPDDLLDPTKQALISKKLEDYFGISEKKKDQLDALLRILSH